MSTMLILFTVALATVMCSGASVDSTALVSGSPSIKTKRGIVDTGHGSGGNQETHRSNPVKSRQTDEFPSQGSEGKSMALKILNSLDMNAPFSGSKYVSGAPNADYQRGVVPSAQFARTSSPSYAVSPTLVRQVESQANFAAPYFNAFNPGNYKITPDGTKPVAQIKSIVPGISTFGDVGHSLLSGFPLHGNQAQPLTQEEQRPVFKTSYPSLKNSEFSSLYVPGFQRLSSSIPVVRTSEKVTQTPDSFDWNEKKVSAVPLPLRQNTADISGFLRSFESQPLLLGSRFQYHANPIQGYKFGQEKLAANPQGNSVPFLSPVPNFQGRVIPIQTNNGNKQFPQYRGAAVAVYPISNNVGQVPGLYQPLHTQPQLHFGSVQAVNAVNSKPSEEIRTDVEVITKKPRLPPSPHDEDDDSDDGYKDIEKEYGRDSEENYDNAGGPGKYFNGAQYQSDFKPSKTFPFKEYDEKFGRYSQQNNNEDPSEKPRSNYQDYQSSDDDDDYEYKTPSSKYHSDYTSEPHHEKYEEDDDEEESQKYEKHQDDDDSEYEPQRYKYGKNIDGSYKRELLKSRNDRLKAEYDVGSRRRERSQQRKNRGDPHNSGHKTFSYGDNEGHSTSSVPRKAPRVVYEEFFGTAAPRKQKNEKDMKDGHVTEKYAISNASPKKDSSVRAAKSSYGLEAPKSNDDSKYENGESYSYASGDSRNSKENSPEDYGFSSSVAGEVAHASDDRNSFHRPTLVSAKVRSLTTAEVLRDLTGI